MDPQHAGVVVIGSANMDIVVTVDRAPSPGETVLADPAALYPGGKGLNQAVAAARAGAPTTFVGALGTDDHGDALAGVLAADGIGADLVRRSTAPTGQAFIVVDGNGENTIIVASGANATMLTLTSEARTAIAEAAVLLMQLELPLPIVLEAAAAARRAGTTVMLNAAPARQLPDELLDNLDYLIVNEHEACLVAGDDDLDRASGALAARVPRLIVTLGSRGSVLYAGRAEAGRVAAPVVTAVDTTGAGDTYCGAFAAATAQGSELIVAAAFATAAAALSVQTLGAVPSIPTRARIEAMIVTASG
ncbi:ribokinase [Marisediminicola sp. UYEF4]|uniref:ribokinase n=1 Tax=Marisediminicola sp. UYEF4 TaxID=1756384 RepID=UPI003395CF82